MSVAGFLPIPFSPYRFMAFSMAYPVQIYINSLVAGKASRYYILTQADSVL